MFYIFLRKGERTIYEERHKWHLFEYIRIYLLLFDLNSA